MWWKRGHHIHGFISRGPVHLAVEGVEMCRVDPCLCPWPDLFHPPQRGFLTPGVLIASSGLIVHSQQRGALSRSPDMLHCWCFTGQKGAVPLVLPGHVSSASGFPLPCSSSASEKAHSLPWGCSEARSSLVLL